MIITQNSKHSLSISYAIVTSKKSNAVSLSNLVIADPNTGELIRKYTGEVVSDNVLSQEKEWRSFDSEDSDIRARAGAPTSLAFHDKGLSTKIGNEATDASGNVLDSATQMRTGDFVCGIIEVKVTPRPSETCNKPFLMLS